MILQLIRLPTEPRDKKHQKTTDPKIQALVCLIFGAFLLLVAASTISQILSPPVWTEKLAVENATGQKLVITDYRYATNVSFEDLLRFLANDTTIQANYTYPEYTCGDFAVHLHDDAELQGIRCGIVGVSLNTTGYTGMNMNYTTTQDPATGLENDTGHGFVVFNTTDEGIVYIDPTGVTGPEKIKGRQPEYMIVYFLKGLPLGEISVNQSEQLDYHYYEQREQSYEEYVDKVLDFNNQSDAYEANMTALNKSFTKYENDRAAFNAEYGNYKAELEDLVAANVSIDAMPYQLKIWHDGLVEWQKALDKMQASLIDQGNQLDAQRARLNEERDAIRQSEAASWDMTTPLGVVDNVIIEW